MRPSTPGSGIVCASFIGSSAARADAARIVAIINKRIIALLRRLDRPLVLRGREQPQVRLRRAVEPDVKDLVLQELRPRLIGAALDPPDEPAAARHRPLVLEVLAAM